MPEERHFLLDRRHNCIYIIEVRARNARTLGREAAWAQAQQMARRNVPVFFLDLDGETHLVREAQ